MANLNSMEMAAVLSNNEHIGVKKGFLGLSKKLFYAPTGVVVDLQVQEFAPDNEKRLVSLITSTGETLQKEVAKGQLTPVPVGHLRLEIALSRDRQFLALQLFRFTDFSYSPITEPRFYEGQETDLVARVL